MRSKNVDEHALRCGAVAVTCARARGCAVCCVAPRSTATSRVVFVLFFRLSLPSPLLFLFSCCCVPPSLPVASGVSAWYLGCVIRRSRSSACCANAIAAFGCASLHSLHCFASYFFTYPPTTRSGDEQRTAYKQCH